MKRISKEYLMPGDLTTNNAVKVKSLEIRYNTNFEGAP